MDQAIVMRFPFTQSHCRVPRSLRERLDYALCDDQKDEFFRLIKYPDFDPDYAVRIFYNDALNIAIAVLNGETEDIIDLEAIYDEQVTPLHVAAAMRAPNITKYLLERGYNVDLKCDNEFMNLKQATPLELALESITFEVERRIWTPCKSIFELLVYVCRLENKFCLETVRLLAQNTSKERVRQTFIDYADKGHIVQLTALFLAAPEVFLSSYFQSIRSGLSPFGMLDLVLNSMEKRTEIEEGLSLLLDVFAIVGDKLVAYIRLQDRSILRFNMCKGESIIDFFLREVAHKKLGVSSRDDYFLRFFKPVRPQADQLESYPDDMPDWQKEVRQRKHEEGIILPFYMKRKDITLDYINRIPRLQPEEAALTYRAIENKLSLMSTLHGLFETCAKTSVKGDKHVPRRTPFLFGLNFESSVPSFTNMASAKPLFDFEFTPTNSLVKKMMQQTKLKSCISFVKLSYIPMIFKRLIK